MALLELLLNFFKLLFFSNFKIILDRKCIFALFIRQRYNFYDKNNYFCVKENKRECCR